MESFLLTDALHYLERGLSVIPVGKNKKPLIKWQDFQKRLATPDELKIWWKLFPDAQIGIVTGKISKIIVVDVEKGGDTSYLPPTTVAKTGGGGMHFYYSYVEFQQNKARIKPLTDIRGDGGYVLAPPSESEKGKYEWLTKVEPLPFFPKHLFGDTSSFKKTDWEEIMKGVPEGQRNVATTQVAGKLLRTFMNNTEAAWQALVGWNNFNEPPLPEQELRSVFESILGREITRRKIEDKGAKAFEESEINPEFESINETLKVSIPTEDGKIVFMFSDIEQTKSREIECMLETTFLIPGFSPKPFSGRLNICSLSARESYARQLNKSFHQKLTWELYLSRACTLIINYLANQDKSHWIEEIPVIENYKYLLEPFLLDNAPNIIFGRGGSGKTYLSLLFALSCITGQPFLDFRPQKKVKVLFVDYENDAQEVQHRLNLLCGNTKMNINLENLTQSFRYFPTSGIPLPELVPTLLKLIKQYSIGLLIVDSAALACGNEPERAETAVRYFNALKKLNITSLTIAHETKSENTKFPFGTVFWYNCARNIWNIQRDENEEEEENILHLGLFHRKSNADKLRSPIALRLFFHSDYADFDYDSISYWEENLSLPRRIYRLLKSNGPMDLKTLKQEFPDVDYYKLKIALNRLKKRTQKCIENIDGFWQISEKS